MKLNNETKIGIMVVVALMILAVITIKTGEIKFSEKGYELKAYFYNIDGVDPNSPVRLNGLEIGLVKDIKVVYGDDTKMELTLFIRDGFKIHPGAQVYVKNMGLLGEKYIGLTLGDSKKGYLPPGSSLQGEEPANLEKIMADGEDIASNLKEISERINERLKINSTSIDEIIANLKATSQKVSSMAESLHERLEINKNSFDDIVSNLDAATQNFEEMSCDLKINPWKLMYKTRERKNSDAADVSKKATRGGAKE
ncbi:MAG: MlaD family protein [Candidatus Omnitrophota bacterium]